MSKKKVGKKSEHSEKVAAVSKKTTRRATEQVVKQTTGQATRQATGQTTRQATGLAGKLARNRKSLIWMGVSLVALVVVVIMIVVIPQKPLDSSFFHDSENKIVLTMDSEAASIEGSIYEPYITHMVYYHDGEKITNLEAYYEYESEEVAKAVYDYLEPNDFAVGKWRNGRFVVFKVDKSKYEGVTVKEIREEAELLKGIDALILDYNENTLKKYGTQQIPTSKK